MIYPWTMGNNCFQNTHFLATSMVEGRSRFAAAGSLQYSLSHYLNIFSCIDHLQTICSRTTGNNCCKNALVWYVWPVCLQAQLYCRISYFMLTIWYACTIPQSSLKESWPITVIKLPPPKVIATQCFRPCRKWPVDLWPNFHLGHQGLGPINTFWYKW